jgi:hypothetical protein
MQYVSVSVPVSVPVSAPVSVSVSMITYIAAYLLVGESCLHQYVQTLHAQWYEVLTPRAALVCLHTMDIRGILGLLALVLQQCMNMVSWQMEQDFVDEHNAYRREVGRDDLVWDAALAEASLPSPRHHPMLIAVLCLT